MVSAVRTGREIVDGGLFQAKLGVALLSVFGLLALGLASVIDDFDSNARTAAVRTRS